MTFTFSTTRDGAMKLTVVFSPADQRRIREALRSLATDPPVDPPAVPSENPRASKPDRDTK